MNYGRSHCHSNSQPLNIKLLPFARNKRLEFIEHVLNVLDEDRFGWRGTMRLTADTDDLPDWLTCPVDETPEHLYDLTDRLRMLTLDLHPGYPQSVTRSETIAASARSAPALVPSPASVTWPRLTSSLRIPLARGSPAAQIGSYPRTHPQHSHLH